MPIVRTHRAIMIGIVYKIWNDVDEEIYIGSTIQSVNKRWNDHKYDSVTPHRKKYNCKLYCNMRLHGQDKFHIQCLESFECENLTELHLKEQEYIDNLKPNLNYQRASRANMTKKEIYREGYQRAKAKRTPEQIEHHKQRVKKWHTENKEKIKQYKKELWLKKKVELQEKSKNSPKITCGCGGVFKEVNRTVHNKSKRHKEFLSSSE